MDLQALEILLEVVKKRSFAEVARSRSMAGSSVSRIVAGLETELGVRLLQRSTRQVAPTEAGEAFTVAVAPLIEELHRARALAADAEDRPRGTLRITVSPTFAQLNVVPLLPEFCRRHPDLAIDLRTTDAVVDLVANQIDVAIRQGDLPDSSLIAHRLCPMVYACCASPAYVEAHGHPQHPAELTRHRCLRYPVRGFSARWLFRLRASAAGEPTETIPVAIDAPYTLSNGLAIRDCAIHGMGVALLPRFNVAEALRDGRLVELLSDYQATASTFDTSAWLLYPSRTYLPLKVRVFRDYLLERFKHGAPSEQRTTGPFDSGS
jgi:DNA-binding transcriptional LysR family regulator